MIAYPTEAVFGLGCDPLNPEAVRRVLDLKKRRIDKGLILIASTLPQLHPFIRPLDARIRQALTDSWPGPVTWAVPASADSPTGSPGENQRWRFASARIRFVGRCVSGGAGHWCRQAPMQAAILRFENANCFGSISGH